MRLAPSVKTMLRPLALVTVLTVVALTGCQTIAPQPYWSQANTAEQRCDIKDIDKGCDRGTPEIWNLRVHDTFRLHFVEFDDQGWLYRDTERGVNAPEQIEWVMRDLSNILKSGKRVRLVVYVHGWKHNAESNDPDVSKFRHFLAQLRGAEVASDTAKATELVGIYVGWRGKSWKTSQFDEFLLNATFWSRKAAAMRVAQGQPRELFARLRALQSDANSEQKKGCPRNGEHLQCRMRTAIVGHSFGGWIVEAALSESMIATLAAEKDPSLNFASMDTPEQKSDKVKERRARLADTILLINPAYEASKYEAIHQLAASLETPVYRPPLLVTITSDGDWATGKAFPAGRWVNGILEKKVSPKESVAIRNTPGHVPRYYTHTLSYDEKSAAECSGWKELYDFDPQRHELSLKKQYDTSDGERLKADIEMNSNAERILQKAFFKDAEPSLTAPWARQFCGGMTLAQLNDDITENKKGNTPVWNIRTTAPIIFDHNNFMTPQFINFIRQLYLDGEFYD